MNMFLIAESEGAMYMNQGVEIMASGIGEALAKYEVIGGAYVPSGDGLGSVWVRHPDGSESAGGIATEEVVPVNPEADEDDVITCPHCDREMHADGSKA